MNSEKITENSLKETSGVGKFISLVFNTALFILLFAFISTILTHGYSYLFSYEKYGVNTKKVHAHFSVAVIKDKRPGLVSLKEYQEGKLPLFLEVGQNQPINKEVKGEMFSLNKGGKNRYEIFHGRDEEMYFSSYRLEDKKLIPLSFRSMNASQVFLIFPFSFIFTLVLFFLIKWRIKARKVRRKHKEELAELQAEKEALIQENSEDSTFDSKSSKQETPSEESKETE